MHPARAPLQPARSHPLLGEAGINDPPGPRVGGASGAPDALMEDQALLARLAVRDAAAFAQLYDRHAAVTFGVACRLLGDSAAAERAVEAAFLTIWRQAANLDNAPIAVRTRLLLLVCRYRREARQSADDADG